MPATRKERSPLKKFRKTCRIPTIREIELLYKKYNTPAHVRAHCRTVAKFAFKLANQLRKKNISVNLKLLHAGALLHDLVRVVDMRDFRPDSFKPAPSKKTVRCWENLRRRFRGLHHAKAAQHLLTKKYPDLAKLIGVHGYMQIATGFSGLEEKLLYYADKRVRHDKVVTLKERLADGRKRNAPRKTHTKKSMALRKKIFALEKEILRLTS